MLYGKSGIRGASLKKDILRKYKITNKMVAEWFSYVSDNSFNGSSCKKEMLSGVSRVIEHIENTLNRQKELPIPPK